MRAARRCTRLLLLLGLLAAGLAIELLVFPLIGVARRERILRGWSRLLLAACAVRTEPHVASGACAPGALPGGCMLLANHRSWLDIFVIDALMPAQFVAKAEIRRWPALGLLCALAGTHFIERHRRHAVHAVIGQLVAALRSGRRVAVFPEGRISDDAGLLPFHANLVQAAVDAPAPVVPVALRYLDAAGGSSQAALYVGDTTFVQSLWRILGEPHTVARLTMLPTVDVPAGATRHAIARAAEAAIGAALELAPGGLRTPATDETPDTEPARPIDPAIAPR